VYFIYPETCGVRLEDMDVLFGDSTAALGTPAAGTPAFRAESDALVRPGSPVPALDIRNRNPRFDTSAAIPGLPIDPPDHAGDRKRAGFAGSKSGGLGGWFSRIIGRGGRSGEGSSRGGGGQYAPIDQAED